MPLKFYAQYNEMVAMARDLMMMNKNIVICIKLFIDEIWLNFNRFMGAFLTANNCQEKKILI